MAKGCALHAQYLVKNADNPAAQGLNMHREDSKLPGYTEEGAKMAKSALIGDLVDPGLAVDHLMGTLFHRIPVIDPRLSKMGVGSAPGGKAGYLVMHYPPPGLGKQTKTVFCPADKQTDVPLAFTKENPSPIPADKIAGAGYPITVSFSADATVTGVKATLKDAANTELEFWLSSPEEPAAGQKRFQRNTVGLIPMTGLKPNTTYTVTVTAMVSKKEWKETWSFTTKKQ
jgi:hypothetical protein